MLHTSLTAARFASLHPVHGHAVKSVDFSRKIMPSIWYNDSIHRSTHLLFKKLKVSYIKATYSNSISYS